jgi:hypothetical protein
MPAKDDIRLGTLTLSPTQLDFDSTGLIFTIPVDAIAEVEWAGFAERWLTIGLRSTSDFARAYPFLLTPGSGPKSPGRLSFLLPPNADLKAAIALAKDFKISVDAAIATAAEAEAKAEKARSEQEAQERAEQQHRQAEARAAAVPAPQPRREEPRQPKVLLALNAYYLDKKPGALMTNFGTSGELVMRNDGIGFAFHELNKLSEDRQHAAENGNIFIPFDSLQTGFVRDQKLLLGARPTMFFVVLTPRSNSEAYARLRPLLTADGEILFTVRGIQERDQVRSLLTRINAGNF